jgi:hypothetical protein
LQFQQGNDETVRVVRYALLPREENKRRNGIKTGQGIYSFGKSGLIASLWQRSVLQPTSPVNQALGVAATSARVTVSNLKAGVCKHDARSRSHCPSRWAAILGLCRAVYQRSQRVGLWIRIRLRGVSNASVISGSGISRCNFVPPGAVSACG